MAAPVPSRDATSAAAIGPSGRAATPTATPSTLSSSSTPALTKSPVKTPLHLTAGPAGTVTTVRSSTRSRNRSRGIVAISLLRFAFVSGSALGTAAEPLEFPLEVVELGVGQVLEIDEVIARALEAPDQLVELEVDGPSVAALRVLDAEH